MNMYRVPALLFCALWLVGMTSGGQAAELNREAKAKLFGELIATPAWYEVTVDLSDYKERGDKRNDKARAAAQSEAEARANEQLIAKVAAQPELEIGKEMVDFSACVKVVEEDKSERYGKVLKVKENGEKRLKATYRFKVACEQAEAINPFRSKSVAARKGGIREFKETAEYWDVVATGYGSYEGFEDIGTKVRIGAMRALDSGSEAVIEKLAEAGIKDEETQQKLREKIKEKRDYAGAYAVSGFAVNLEVVVPVRISKKDGSLFFLPQ